MLGDLADQLRDAIGEIRRLARGIYPPVLAANGLPVRCPEASGQSIQ
jgi:signal transduction histidine kinase